jgi:dihydropteroate synthase
MKLRCRDRVIDVDRPLVMGVLNATPDSFSDGGELDGVAAQVRRGLELIGEGADVLDIGGQSAITGVPEISIANEIHRLIPVVEGIRAASNCVISVDTYRPAVAHAALRAGADIVNDISGVLDPELAEVVLGHRAGFVVMHTRWKPKTREDARLLYRKHGVLGDVVTFLRDRVDSLLARGLDAEQLVLDPGPDFAKTAAQTVDVLRGLDAIVAFGRPVLLALSRKDFIGVITQRPPKERLAGTLAAIAATTRIAPSSILRVHDVRETREFLAVLDVLDGRREIDSDAGLDKELRWQARIAPEST